MTRSDCIESREADVEKVFDALMAIWPEHMAAQTGAGLTWGQLIATAAVEALASGQEERDGNA